MLLDSNIQNTPYCKISKSILCYTIKLNISVDNNEL